jgi:hypothetical protein
MKTLHSKTIAVLLGTALVATAFLSVSTLFQSSARAASTPTLGGEQYKVFEMNRAGIKNLGDLERMLNQLGTEGWKLRAVAGTTVFLAR